MQTETETAVPRSRAGIGSARARLASVLGRQRAIRRLVGVASSSSAAGPAAGSAAATAEPAAATAEPAAATAELAAAEAARAAANAEYAPATAEAAAGRTAGSKHAGAQAPASPGYLADRFRLPTPDDAAPEQRRLIGVCAWAGLLGIGGVTIALRVLLALFQVDSGWYPVKACAIGLVGLMFTVAGFASVHRPVLPWIMLGCATAALGGAIMVTVAA